MIHSRLNAQGRRHEESFLFSEAEALSSRRHFILPPNFFRRFSFSCSVADILAAPPIEATAAPPPCEAAQHTYLMLWPRYRRRQDESRPDDGPRAGRRRFTRRPPPARLRHSPIGLPPSFCHFWLHAAAPRFLSPDAYNSAIDSEATATSHFERYYRFRPPSFRPGEAAEAGRCSRLLTLNSPGYDAKNRLYMQTSPADFASALYIY